MTVSPKPSLPVPLEAFFKSKGGQVVFARRDDALFGNVEIQIRFASFVLYYTVDRGEAQIVVDAHSPDRTPLDFILTYLYFDDIGAGSIEFFCQLRQVTDKTIPLYIKYLGNNWGSFCKFIDKKMHLSKEFDNFCNKLFVMSQAKGGG